MAAAELIFVKSAYCTHTGRIVDEGMEMGRPYKTYKSCSLLYCTLLYSWSSAKSKQERVWIGIHTMSRNVKISFYIIVHSPMAFSLHTKASDGYVPPPFLLFPSLFCREEMCPAWTFQMEITVWSVLSWIYQWSIHIWKSSRSPQLEELFPNRTFHTLTLEEGLSFTGYSRQSFHWYLISSAVLSKGQKYTFCDGN